MAMAMAMEWDARRVLGGCQCGDFEWWDCLRWLTSHPLSLRGCLLGCIICCSRDFVARCDGNHKRNESDLEISNSKQTLQLKRL